MRIPQGGFTVVELILVLMIVGVLAAVVGPRFFDRQVFDERLYFEQSLTAVRYAQKLALSSGCSIRARVDNGGYSLSYASACGAVPAGALVSNPSGVSYAAGLPSGVSVQQALDVTFNSRGCVAAGSACGSGSQIGRVGGFSLAIHADTGFVEAHP
ncbi:type II secretion system GspH family protein [Pseudomonas stutzeri]|uniref:Prepilin-type cleavage/methylation domain-containing protein n=1 Tax=Stutzerimonas stutzeri TaxID=316 RepID=A0A2N8S7Z2_STUST|nr:type II secretion system protein [Stutzerimonas stutzeri]MCQ4297058.1 type II secretion system GspH family protein [Stutzerimonas stutzeri]PNF82744.1 prepilin-type cleavage/methylation domain-containing protein [Stutzerimonas stutzeri]